MVKKSEFIWNTIASITTAALSAVLLLIVTRTNGSDLAGMFAITFSTATILNAVGDFGMRVFQVTDTNHQFSFDDYLYARFFLSTIMLLSAVLFCLFSSYDTQKLFMCLLLVGYRFVECISDTFQGELQLNQRLDIASQSLFIRTAGAILVFGLVDIVTHNVLISCIFMIIWGVFISIIFDAKKLKLFTKITWKFHLSKVKSLILICSPTFMSTLLNLYIVNAPKYAIDSLMQYNDQLIFNVLFLPTFTINLMSLFILKPILLTIGVMWNEKRYSEFSKVILKMSLLILALTAIVEMGCFFIGIPVLSFIYGIELTPYLSDLLILIVSGGLSALSVAFFYALTTMRQQKLGAIPYIMSSIIAILICYPLVSYWQIRGAAIASVVIMLVLSISSGLIVYYKFRRITEDVQ